MVAMNINKKHTADFRELGGSMAPIWKKYYSDCTALIVWRLSLDSLFYLLYAFVIWYRPTCVTDKALIELPLDLVRPWYISHFHLRPVFCAMLNPGRFYVSDVLNYHLCLASYESKTNYFIQKSSTIYKKTVYDSDDVY